MEYYVFFRSSSCGSVSIDRCIMNSHDSAGKLAERYNRRFAHRQITAVYTALTERCVWRQPVSAIRTV